MENLSEKVAFELPVIDMGSGRKREDMVAAMREAAETWGAFQMVNHGIPDAVLDTMLEGLRRFHAQPAEAKNEYFAVDVLEAARKSKLTLSFDFRDDIVTPDQLPSICRSEVEEYANSIIQLKETISELLSEGLGLRSDYLSQLEWMKTETLRCHYYPACPQQDNSSGLKMHSDLPFLTILLQDNVGGFQVLHDGNWVDVPPRRGSLIANIGDLMQLVTNGKYRSSVHRVVGAVNEARVSAACFFMPSSKAMAKTFSPIEELLSEANPPLYKEVTFKEFTMCYLSKEAEGLDTLNLPAIRI